MYNAQKTNGVIESLLSNKHFLERKRRLSKTLCNHAGFILLDMPPNRKEELQSHRVEYGEEPLYMQHFEPATDWERELEIMKVGQYPTKVSLSKHWRPLSVFPLTQQTFSFFLLYTNFN